jgi:hypothetical protein
VSGDHGGGASDVERYEQLRARAVSGEPDGWRNGLEMLERRGVAAWARAWRTTTSVSSAPIGRPSVAKVSSDARQIVDALATMALACAASG